MNKDELIDAIVQIEWPMFAGVNNEGGKAACQMDLATFRIMRISQYSAWGEELLESCLADLRAAQNQGRNLMTEKYARMMKTTFPDEYPAIEKSLPPRMFFRKCDRSRWKACTCIYRSYQSKAGRWK